MIPEELKINPPRNISYRHDLFKKNRRNVRVIFIAGVLMPFILAALFLFRFGVNEISSGFYWGIGLSSFMFLFGLVYYLNTKMCVELFRNGEVTEGKIISLQAPADRQGNSYVIIKLAYHDKTGNEYRGYAGLLGKKRKVDKQSGDSIIIFYKKEKPRSYAIYFPSLGMMRARANRVKK